ncbi:CHY zinc finger protein [Thalassobacillus hwangdonensis]|uniref:CHY zinc finger protein n=1 Tax=Thalassobacillus hwangdonensis TaxID=546108 RepID=A0ABW3L158_9BACI
MSCHVKGVLVKGVGVDEQTRCSHYRSDRDVIAIKFKCCDTYYSCISCHEEIAGHPVEVWPREEHSEKAILCGICGTQHRIDTYLKNSSACVSCGSSFNPGCKLHHHLYFE